VRIITTGGLLVYHPSEATSYSMTLDMRRGVLLTGSRLTNERTAAVRVRTLRLASLRERELGLHVVNLEIEKGEIELTLEASFEGLGLGLVSERLEQDLGIWRTRYS
jgi:trehalose/maltose hydrolase-like predicted phosphorylase